MIERELLQAEREKQQLRDALADLNARIGQPEQAAANLQSLYEYCRDVERELATFGFAEKRLALEALGAEVRASGREWSLVANLPIDGVVPRTSC